MKRIPRLLLIAFALSLLVHLIVALILHPAAPSAQNQPEVVSLERRPASIAVKRTVTPPPPPPTRPPAPKSVSSAAPRAPKGLAGPPSGAGTPAPAAPAAATPTPAPVVAASGGCSKPNAEPAVSVTPPPPDIAPAARASGTNGVALVRVQLNVTGDVTGADVVQSTGNASLDLVAVTMARGARYTPGLHDCKPIASAYTFSVKFVAW